MPISTTPIIDTAVSHSGTLTTPPAAFLEVRGYFTSSKIAMIYAFCIPKTSKKILKRKIKAKAKGIKILIGFLAPYLVFYIF